MVASDAVDGAGDGARPQPELHRSPPAGEVAQHERQPEPVGEAARRLLAVRGHLLRRRQQGGDGVQRQHGLGATGQVAGHPVPPDGPGRDLEHLAVDETDAQRPAALSHRGDAVAQRTAAEAESLLLRVALALLGADAGLELRLEVGEQLVPAHPRTLLTPSGRGGDFSTARLRGMLGCRADGSRPCMPPDQGHPSANYPQILGSPGRAAR